MDFLVFLVSESWNRQKLCNPTLHTLNPLVHVVPLYIHMWRRLSHGSMQNKTICWKVLKPKWIQSVLLGSGEFSKRGVISFGRCWKRWGWGCGWRGEARHDRNIKLKKEIWFESKLQQQVVVRPALSQSYSEVQVRQLMHSKYLIKNRRIVGV